MNPRALVKLHRFCELFTVIHQIITLGVQNFHNLHRRLFFPRLLVARSPRTDSRPLISGAFLMEHSSPTAGTHLADTRSPTSAPRIARMVAFGAAAAVIILGVWIYLGSVPPGPSYTRLKMGGTSAVAVILQNRWKAKYREEKGVDIEYASTGSTAGITGLLDGACAVAFTHAPLSDEQRKKAVGQKEEFVQIPVLLCGVAVVYNLKELKSKDPLNISGQTLADIFLGKIKNWDDPALKSLNPGVELPATEIAVVHREDSSGTTQIFTEYLAAVSPAWCEQFGSSASEVKWPVGEGAPRNLGVAKRVDQIEGAVGYVDRLFTSYEDMHLDHAAIQNKDQTGFVRAQPENMTAAAAGVIGNLADDLSFTLANQPGDNAYPISGVIYAVCRKSQSEANRKIVVDFLRWVTHEGQPFAAKMDYAPLPAELAERASRRIELIP
jgi:phosphate transport system substrate-binding protein